MRSKRVYCAGVVLGVALVGAVWLYTYRTWQVVHYELPGLRRTVIETRVSAQPWWSVYASLALVLLGAGVSLWLLPEGRRFVRRALPTFGDHSGGPRAKPSP